MIIIIIMINEDRKNRDKWMNKVSNEIKSSQW